MTRPKSTKKVRLNLEMSESVRKRLEALRDKTDADSLAEVIRRALAAYELVVTGREEGAELILRGACGKEETVVIL